MRGKMYNKVYLIDSENVGDEWVGLMEEMDGDDCVYVFYTEKSNRMNCGQVSRLMEYGVGKVYWIKCFEGSNALDFQLVSELGAMIESKSAEEYIIISKDKGYDAVVRYWTKKGVVVSKQSGAKEIKEISPEKKTENLTLLPANNEAVKEKPSKNKQEKNKSDKNKAEKDKSEKDKGEKNKPEKNKAAKDKKSSSTDKKSGSDEFLLELMKSVNVSDYSLFYSILVAFEGQEKGLKLYRRVKELHKERKDELQKLLLKDRKQRGVHYVGILLEREGYSTTDAGVLYEMILNGPKKNKDKYGKQLVTRYGKEKGWTYYSLTKGHYNYVKQL